MNNVLLPIQKVGVLSPPAWFDITPLELMSYSNQRIRTIQSYISNVDYNDPASMQAGLQKFQDEALNISLTGVDLIAQSGTQFSAIHGKNAKMLRDFQAETQDKVNRPFVMMGLSLCKAIHFLAPKKIAFMGTYYDPQMMSQTLDFLQCFDISPHFAQTWVDQNLFCDYDAVEALNWSYSMDLGLATFDRLAASNADFDCIVLPGASVRLIPYLDELEEKMGCPIVTADGAFYWDILRELKLSKSEQCKGILFSTLSDEAG